MWDEPARRWRLRTDRGEELSCQFYVMASGCLSVPKTPDIEGAGRFDGDVYFTSSWPHQGVDFTGQRVAVIGTGSSGIQAIPLIAAQASTGDGISAHPELLDSRSQWTGRRGAPGSAGRGPGRLSRGGPVVASGVPSEVTDISGVTATEEVRRSRFESAWESGELFKILGVFNDQLFNPASNQIVADMIREKIHTIVNDPETAEALCPKDHPFGTKRPCLDTNYYRTFNLPHVRLIDLRTRPIATITESGIDTVDESMEFDTVVFATGFDAMTGPLAAVDIVGRDGIALKDKWADGPSTYLGLTTVGFPNLFMITGPGSPSVLSNMMVSIEQHVDWVADCVDQLRAGGFDTIEPTPAAESGWDRHVQDCGNITLYPTANSWYMGSNVPGKPRVFLPYIGGVDAYRAACDEVVARGYLGFALSGPGPSQCNDGVIRRLQPDVAMVLEAVAALQLPPLESMSVEDARASMVAATAIRPPGPDVGEVVDGVLVGAAGKLDYRLYRPASPGPHPMVAYFHGGGWVLGSLDSDDPFCRDLCARSDTILVSVNYRHAPEDRFPAAVDDAFAAVQWMAANAVALGGIPGQLAVAGWSAGGNLAAVTCQLARDAAGPEILGQLLLTPVVDADLTRPSYRDNGDGYVLTAPLMGWFWDHYADPTTRSDPRVSPLGGNLSNLPPAVVVTAEFDPLRDEGTAYAEALAAAGVPVRHVKARGQVHTSVTMVDVVLSGAPVRAQMAKALKEFFPAPVRV